MSNRRTALGPVPVCPWCGFQDFVAVLAPRVELALALATGTWTTVRCDAMTCGRMFRLRVRFEADTAP